MSGGLIGKLLLTVMVVILIWRGFRLWSDMQKRLAQADAERERQSRAPAAMELAPCRSCGTYIARGTACPNCEPASHRRA